MAEFLTTSATTYHLEELIKNAQEKVILICPYLKLNQRLKELLEDKNRLKIDVRIVYGKSELQPEVVNWVKNLEGIRTSFLKELHAKCYLNEDKCIITSMNLYEYSQLNNYEMGILIERSTDRELYQAARKEAQQIVRMSDEFRMSLEKVAKDEETEEPPQKASAPATATSTSTTTLTSSKLAKKLGMKTGELLNKLVAQGFLELREDKHYLTDKGKSAGGEFCMSKRFGPYFVWPQDLAL